ncbi:hypothetical protein FB446DRAFT_471801 [Lentinula raphanica]|nr:hypothetical protein FB446DRAFT_471801 [Lentinula raphanica]
MPSDTLHHRLSGWFDRRLIGTALQSHRQAPWRRRLAVYATIASIASSSGSAYASYKTNTNISLAFAIISIIVSVVQLFVSKDIPKLVDPEERPLSSVITTVETGGIPFVFRLSVLDPSSAGRTSSRQSPPSSHPLVRRERRRRIPPTDHGFPSTEGGDEASLGPDDDSTNRGRADNDHVTSASTSSPSGLMDEDPEHAEQIVSAHEAPSAEGASEALLDSDSDSSDSSDSNSIDPPSLASTSSSPSPLLVEVVEKEPEQEQIYPIIHKAPSAEKGHPRPPLPRLRDYSSLLRLRDHSNSRVVHAYDRRNDIVTVNGRRSDAISTGLGARTTGTLSRRSKIGDSTAESDYDSEEEMVFKSTAESDYDSEEEMVFKSTAESDYEEEEMAFQY